MKVILLSLALVGCNSDEFISRTRLPRPPREETPTPSRGEPFSKSFLADIVYQRQLDRVALSGLTLNDEVRLYQNGQALVGVKDVVSGARKFLFINMLSVDCDAATEELFSDIEKKAAQGVDVRLIINKNYAYLSLSCLDRLRRSKVDVVKAKTHSSYLVNDQSETVIGSESLARMFFNSTGFNSLDRDMMLKVKGPLASDVLQNFLTIWDENRGPENRDTLSLVAAYKAKVAAELQGARRGDAHYRKWLSREPRLLCRFSAQRPAQRSTALSDLLLSLVKNSRKKITFSGVKVGATPVVAALQEKARTGVPVEFYGNGWDGGNGELTMVLDELIRDSSFPRVLGWVRSLDMHLQARERTAAYAQLAAPNLTIFTHFNFLHYKAWSFDHHGVWVGSANPNDQAYSDFHESGAFCLDSALATDFAAQVALDKSNSVSY